MIPRLLFFHFFFRCKRTSRSETEHTALARFTGGETKESRRLIKRKEGKESKKRGEHRRPFECKGAKTARNKSEYERKADIDISVIIAVITTSLKRPNIFMPLRSFLSPSPSIYSLSLCVSARFDNLC